MIENSKKLQKNTVLASFLAKIGWKKTLLWLRFPQKLVGKCREREKIKIIVSFRSYPMRNRKFQTNSKKIQKI